MNAIAIIPARGGSKRFPRKNVALLSGKPLLTYPLSTAINTKIFSHVFVTTEDKGIAEIAKSEGGTIHDRSLVYATDESHELDACIELLEDFEKQYGSFPEYLCVIYPTAVLIQQSDLQGAYDQISSSSEIDSLMCVSEPNYHPYKVMTKGSDGYLKMMFPTEAQQRSQGYPKALCSNGTFYWLRTSALIANKEKRYYQDRLCGYAIPSERAIDIDYEEDLEKVKTYYNVMKELNNEL